MSNQVAKTATETAAETAYAILWEEKFNSAIPEDMETGTIRRILKAAGVDSDDLPARPKATYGTVIGLLCADPAMLDLDAKVFASKVEEVLGSVPQAGGMTTAKSQFKSVYEGLLTNGKIS